MQLSVKGFIAPKEAEEFSDCADRFAFSSAQNKFAISDGVSKSFFPKIWADILVKNWVDSKELDDEKLIQKCQEEWLIKVTQTIQRPETKWYSKNAFNRREPGLATFVGLRFYKSHNIWRWKCHALGDSYMFFLPKKSNDISDLISLSSKPLLQDFDNYPDYLTSIGSEHKGIKAVHEGELSEGTFYLMTDAMAEWMLDKELNAVSEINRWQSQKDFEQFVSETRRNKALSNDDNAILIIRLEGVSQTDLEYVQVNITDIDQIIESENRTDSQANDEDHSSDTQKDS